MQELLMSFLKDKKQSIESIFDDIEKSISYSKGLKTFIENIDSAHMNEENTRQKFRTMMKVLNNQNTVIRKLLFVCLVYMQGSNFDVDVASALTKLGRGDEALREMYKSKMGDK